MNTTWSDEARPQLRADLIAEPIDGERLVLDLAQNVYFSLNTTGQIIWDALLTGADVAACERALARAFEGIPAAQLRADLEDFLNTLSARGLLS